MPTREEKIAFLQSQSAPQGESAAQAPKPKTREEKLAFIQAKQMQQDPSGGESKGILGSIAGAMDTVSSYTSAPARSAVAAIQDGKNPITAFADQFGEDTSKAPSGKQIAEKAGVSGKERIVRTAEEQKKFDEMNNPGWAASMKQMGKEYQPVKATSSEDAGFLVEMAVDPLNLLPLVGPAKKALGATKLGVQGAAKAEQLAQKAGSMFSKTKVAQSQAAEGLAESAAKAGATISGGGVEVEQSGKLFNVKAPQSLDELRNWKPEANAGEMPGKQRLQQIEQILPDLKTKPLKYHYDMMENPKAMKQLKLQFENLPSNDAKKIAAYNWQMVKDSESKVLETIQNISGSEPKTLTDAGYDFINSAKDKYKSEKEILGPMFDEIRRTAPGISPQESSMLAVNIGENSKIGKLMDQNKDTGKLFLKKNTPRSGISDSEHGVLARVIDDLNDGMTFEELQKTREFLRKNIDPSNPAASEEISNVRSILLGQMESMASQRGPKVGETFKAYAVNERARENIEKIIGGRIESLDAMFSSNPDKVVQKIFSNPNYVKVVGEYVGPEKMQSLIGSYLNNGMRKAFDPARGFDPSAVRNWIKNNKTFVDTHLAPEARERLSAAADYGYFGKRFLDEVNPSGTAASLVNALEPQNFMQRVKTQGVVGSVRSELANRVDLKLRQRQSTRTVNEMLGGQNPDTAGKALESVSRGLNQGAQAVKSAGKSAATVQVSSNPVRELLRDGRIPKVSQEEEKPKEPLKGQEKWASDGFEKLLEHAGEDTTKNKLIKNKDALLRDQKLKDLLIRASDLKPGSKSMNEILIKIKDRVAKEND